MVVLRKCPRRRRRDFNHAGNWRVRALGTSRFLKDGVLTGEAESPSDWVEGFLVRGRRRLPKTPADGTVTPGPAEELSPAFSSSFRSGLRVRATEKGGKRVAVSVFLRPSVFFSSFSFFPSFTGVGRGFLLMNGRLLPTLKLNLGLNVVTLIVVVVGGVGVVKVVGAGVKNSELFSSGMVVRSSSGEAVVILGLWKDGNLGLLGLSWNVL